MRIVEYQHRNENGGNMVHLDNATWEHGEEVLIFSRQELTDAIRLASLSHDDTYRILNQILDDIKKATNS